MNSSSEDAQALAALVKDYNAAAKTYVPGWRGGMNRKVAAELIRLGWRKPADTN